jgi:dihydrofolate synthase/folylpolyglutamate synthase
MRRLLGYLDNPHQQLKCVHVAGTKGKGSTCAMLASMLQACGYTVGLYTSPHLVDLRERVSIDGNMIGYATVVDTFKQLARIEGRFNKPKLSFFEIMTATALKHFADQAVDIAVIETGLGGRLDCTNVVTPLVTGITQISLDHTNILGKDVTSIAREKAGIFKKNVPAISIEQSNDVSQQLSDAAEQNQTPLEFTGDQIEFSYRFEANRELGPHSRVCLTTPTSRYEHLAVPLKGEHQALNCGLALAMIDKLKIHDFSLPEDLIIEGLAQTQLHGRMEQVHDQPRVVIDGAHNAASIQALVRALGAHITYDSMVMLFGCGQDKDVDGMLKQLALGADKVIFTRAKSNPRAMDPEDLLNRFNELAGKMAQTAPNLEEALHVAGRAVSREDLVVITGSFYLAGESRKHFIDRANRQQRR